jgi:class 3 adenylate cyclase
MGTPLVLVFSVVDFFFVPHLLQKLFFLRLTVIPAALLAWSLGKVPFLKKQYWEVPGLSFVLFLGLYSAALVYFTGTQSLVYYAGLNLIAIGSLSFMPWSRSGLVASIVATYGPYFLLFLMKPEIAKASDIVPTFAFILSTIFISGFVGLTLMRYREEDFKFRRKLKAIVREQDLEIKKKATEAVHLSSLARQFSPQVIKAIQSSSVDINVPIRREVSVLFVDAKGSTERAGRLDHSAFLEVIVDLYKNVNQLLLKHHLTVGTFLGDGVLAFNNAPEKRENHLLETIGAAVEILDFCRSKKTYYSEIWRKEFFVRLGINVGYCNIGFFPSPELGTYTVLGDTVNQASRFCALAEPDTLCIPKHALRKLGDGIGRFDVFPVRQNGPIRGLEGENFDLFGIRGLKNTTPDQPQDELCPLCGRALTPKEISDDVLMMSCVSSCGYVDIIPIEKLKKAASH